MPARASSYVGRCQWSVYPSCCDRLLLRLQWNWCGYRFWGQEAMLLMAVGKNKNRTSNLYFFFVRSAMCFWHFRMCLLVTDKDRIIYINNWVRFWVILICYHNGTILKEEKNVIYGSNSLCFLDSWLLCYCILKAKDENKGGIVRLSVEIKVSWRGPEPCSASLTPCIERQTSHD